MSKEKATIVITVTSEDGRTIEKKYSGTNKQIRNLLIDFGILSEKEYEILDD